MQSTDFGPIVSPLAQYARGGRTKRGPLGALPPALAARHAKGMQVLGALGQAVVAHKLRQAILAHLIAGGR